MAGERDAAPLVDRMAERTVIDRLLSTVRGGESQILVMHGDAGVGKTALLHYLTAQTTGFRIVRAAGIQSEMELAFAGLHQLCASLERYQERLPQPQQNALQVAFGVRAGPAPDKFLVGLAVLGLLSVAAEDQPLLVIVDDAQWLDRASAQAIGFVARRLEAEPVGLVFAAREPGEELAGLTRLAVGALPEADARTLLEAALTGPVDAQVRDQIVAEAQGNPLALLELPRGLTAAEMAGGFGLPGPVPVVGRIEESFLRQLRALPQDTQQLLVIAAADPSGDPALVWRAAAQLGIETSAAGPAADAGLIQFDTRVQFRHPLVRSVAYLSARSQERQRVHAALAKATDAEADPDRRAWHRAQAAAGRDEDVAAELEASAGRARARGGLAAVAAFLERAAVLTPDPARYAGRALAAADAKLQAGAYDAARELLAIAQAGPLSQFQHAQAELVRAELAFVANRGSDAPPLLLAAARRLEPIDADLARATYLDTMAAAMFAGRLASPGGGLRDVARQVSDAPSPQHGRRSPDLLLDGMAKSLTDGYAAAVPVLREALAGFGRDVSDDEELRSLWVACIAALHVWDDAGWNSLAARFVQLARDTGSLSELPLALTMRAHLHLCAGELSSAASLIGELQAAAEATGGRITPYGALGLAALRGDAAETSRLTEAATQDATLRGEGVGIAVSGWAEAVLANGLGRYQDAVAAARRASSYDGDPGVSNWALAELVEAATRSGESDTAARALARLTETTTASGTDWALGVEARSRALVAEGEAVESRYHEAVDRLGRTRMRPDLARAHLLYGEWLRRERRRADAREQLRTAYHMLQSIGMTAFAVRAGRELQAAGETARRRPESASSDRRLTAQENQVARLARDGLSNPEIGARLFISARTVQYHLSKVFTKLGIGSRAELSIVLPGD